MTAPSHRISVAMATYNGEKYIQEQLDSIARQELLPLELVVTDDGSTDATLSIIDAFAVRAPFAVRVFRNEARLGFADNFLKAASLCEGDLIAFCDQDDIWMEQKLAVCSRYLETSGALLIMHTARVGKDLGDHAAYYPYFSSTETLSSAYPFPYYIPGFAMVFRAGLLELGNPAERPPLLRYHDQWVWFLAATAGCIATIADVLAIYRQHDNNTFGAPQSRSFLQRVSNFPHGGELVQRAELERACSHILLATADHFPDWTDRLRISGKKLEVRADLLRTRARIYTQESTIWDRGNAFVRLCFQGAYFPTHADNLLGFVAAIRDLLFGVPRLDRFLYSRTALRGRRC